MNARTSIAFLLLLVESIALGLAGGRLIHVMVPVIVAGVLAITNRRIRLTTERYAYALAAIAALAVLWWALTPPRLNNALQMFPVTGAALLYVGGLYCIWHQVLQLVVELRQQFGLKTGPFPSFPFIGAFPLAISGHYTYWATLHSGYAAIALAFVVLTALYYLARDEHWMFLRYSTGFKVFSAALLALSVAAGVLLATAIRQNEGAINSVLDRLTVDSPAESELGFSREGRLTNVTERRSAGDQRPALFVSSDRVPGYMRGLVFDTYRAARWSLPNPERWLSAGDPPSSDEGQTENNRRYFRFADDETAEPAIQMEVFTTTALLDTVFLPATATAVFVDTDLMGLDRANAVRETKPERRPGYTAVVPVEPAIIPPTDSETLHYTMVPAMDPRIVSLAGEITADAETSREKALAIESYFLRNYEYALGIQVPIGYDPLTYFLLEKPSAHCEYFASGAAILLRLSGVPARYVTGFVVVERNSTGDFYVARNKDAHAWVEAWDPDIGWFIVEATPPAGVPQEREATSLSELRDALSLAWSRFRDGLGDDPFNAVVDALSAVAGAISESVYGKVLVGLLLGLLGVRYAKRRAGVRRPPTASEEVRRLRELVKRADAIARESGLNRGAHETVRAFAERIAAFDSDRAYQELAEWYREYERVRYRDTANDSAYAFLESSLPAAR